MNRDDRVGFVEAALLTFGLYLLFVYLLFALNTYSPATIFLVLGFSVAAAILLSSLFLPRFSLVTSSALPGPVLSYIAYQLRRRGFRVEEVSNYATIRLGSTVAVRVHVRRSLSGSRVSYQAFATPAGWGTLVTLIVIPWAAPAGVAGILYAFRKSRRFARDMVIPLVSEAESAAPFRPEDETLALLLSGLSEGHRLAAEAYEALRSAYADSVTLAAVTGFLAWAVVFVVFAMVPSLAGFPGGLLLGMSVAVAVGMGTAAGLILLTQRKIGVQMTRCRSWSDRLRDALSREAVRAPPESAESSAIELLLEASRQIPSWLEGRRRAGLSADQAADWIVFVVSLAAGYAMLYGFHRLSQAGLLDGSLELLSGVGLGCVAYGLWAHWKRKRDEALARTRTEWRRRIDALQSRLDHFLQGL